MHHFSDISFEVFLTNCFKYLHKWFLKSFRRIEMDKSVDKKAMLIIIPTVMNLIQTLLLKESGWRGGKNVMQEKCFD